MMFTVGLVVAAARRTPNPEFEQAVADAEHLLDLAEELGADAYTAASWAAPENLAGRRRPDDPAVRQAVERVAGAFGIPLAELYVTPPPSPADVPCPHCGAARYAPCVVVKGPGAGQSAPFHARRLGVAREPRERASYAPRCGHPKRDGEPCRAVAYGGPCRAHRKQAEAEVEVEVQPRHHPPA